MNVGLQVALILVLILIEGYFAASEIALISARRALLQQRAEAGSKGAAIAVALIDDPTRLLSTIQIGITVLGFLAASEGAIALAEPVGSLLERVGVPASFSHGTAVVLVTLVISYVTLVIGELVPKRLGLQRAENVAIAVSRQVLFLERLFAPVVWLLSVSAAGVSALIGVRGTGGRPGVSEEEIKLLVTEQGSLLDEEKRMIHEIFELGDTVAREVMVPRVDMMLAEDTATVARVAEMLQGTGFSRMPIFHESHDSIVGIALLKDLVGPLAKGESDAPIVKHMREPVFVPESKGILSLLSEMRALHNQLAIVVDEYGGTAGLVTLEDIVEEIVGEIADEFDREHKYIQQLGEREWVLDGRLDVAEAAERHFPVEESDEYETIAGWMLSKLGHIPTPGEAIERRGYTFRVQAMRRRRIARIRVIAPDPKAAPAPAPRDDAGDAE